MSNSDRFINKYSELEKMAFQKFPKEVKAEYGAVAQLERMKIFDSIKKELRYIRELRNFFQHNPKIDSLYPVEATDSLVELLDDIIFKVQNPPKAYDKCIKFDKICYATKDELIYEYMVKMKENVYTHIPILDNKIVVGVFSENTLLGALTEEEIIYDKNVTKFSDKLIFKHCQLDNHVSEIFKFVSKNSYLEDVKELFRNSYEDNKRLSLIFITEHGKPDEKIMGIITPWDVLSNN